MAFTETWDAAFEALPADSDDAKAGADRIRDLKLAIRERLAIGHSWAGDASDGIHLSDLWTTPAFVAGDYTGDGTMTWTVIAGNVTAFKYTLSGKKMTVVFWITSTTVGGGVSSYLQLKIPASKTAATTTATNACMAIEGGVLSTAYVQAVGTNLQFAKVPTGNWVAGAGHAIFGQITFEIQ